METVSSVIDVEKTRITKKVQSPEEERQVSILEMAQSRQHWPCVLVSYFVNLTQAMVIWEEEPQLRKCLNRIPIGKSVGHALAW